MKVKKGRILPIKGKILGNPMHKKNKKKVIPDLRKTLDTKKNFFKVDPRPVRDKKYVSFCLKEIKIFLNQNEYKSFKAHRIFFPLKIKDFFQVIYFLIRKLDKNFEIEAKPEENIPKILKIIGYPVSITKTTLMCTNSLPGSFVLLNCLYWMVELCMYDLKTTFENESINKPSLKKNLFWNQLVRNYKKGLLKKRNNDIFPRIIELTLLNEINRRKQCKDRKFKFTKKINSRNYFLTIVLYIMFFFNEKIKLISKSKHFLLHLQLKLEINRFGLVSRMENSLSKFEEVDPNKKKFFSSKFGFKKITYFKILKNFLEINYNTTDFRLYQTALSRLILKSLTYWNEIIFFRGNRIIPTWDNYLRNFHLKFSQNLNRKNFQLKSKLFFSLKEFEIFFKIQITFRNKIIETSRIVEGFEIFYIRTRQNRLNFNVIFHFWNLKNYSFEKGKCEKIDKTQEKKLIGDQSSKKAKQEKFIQSFRQLHKAFNSKRLIFLKCLKELIGKIDNFTNVLITIGTILNKKEKLINWSRVTISP